MSRTLISFVGDSDPGEKVALNKPLVSTDRDGPLLSIVRQLHHEKIPIESAILFYTPESHEETFQQVAEILREYYPQLSVTPAPVHLNPSIEEEVYAVVLAWLDKNPEVHQHELHFNVASGTPAMRSVWTLLKYANLVQQGTLWYSQNPERRYTGERVHRVGLSHMEQARSILSASHLMKGMAFAEAGKVLHGITNNPAHITAQRLARAGLWSNLLSVYDLWDRSAYEDAKLVLDQVYSDAAFTSLPTNIRKIVDEQHSSLHDLALYNTQHTTGLPVLIDIYASISRRYAVRQAANVGTRTRRILEGAIKYIIAQDQSARVTERNKVLHSSSGFICLMTEALYYIDISGPISFDPPVTPQGLTVGRATVTRKNLEAIRTWYKGIDTIMNKSVEVHGFKSPTQDEAERCIKVSKQVLAFVTNSRVQDFPEPDTLSFGSATVVKLAEELISWI